MPTDEIRLWAMEGSGDAVRAVRLKSADRTQSEKMLEDTLVNNPEMLMEGLTLVGRQTPMEGGFLDLLGVDADGRLVVFELKRGTLSREAVAQVIDYASYLDSMADAELANLISERSGSRDIEKIGNFEDWYEGKSEGDGLSGLKPVRMVLVGLGVDATTTRMAQFLAKGGMDFSLLTFQGYTHDGKTLLARQVQVEAGPESEEPENPKRRPNWIERRVLLDNRIEERTQQLPEARKLWGAVLEMFRDNLNSPREMPGRGNNEWAKRRLYLRMPGGGRSLAAIQFGLFDEHPDFLSVLFFQRAVRLCLPEFTKLRQEIPFKAFPANSPHREEGVVEIQFLFNSLTEWEMHKDNLAAVTRSVYEAYESGEDDGSQDEDDE